MELSLGRKIRSIFVCFLIMLFGLLIFKFFPMQIFGAEILFDASMHITVAVFVLYFFWYFIDQNKSLRIPYFIFSLAVLAIISMQRVLDDAHNDAGILTGLIVSIIAIIVSRWDYFKGKFSF